MIVYPNNWIPTKDLEEISNNIYDFLVIGSGAGGGAVLSRLCELLKGQGAIKIGMIEKGGKLFHSNALNIPTMNEHQMFSQLLPDNSTPIGDSLPQYPGAREVYALGGRTLFWNGSSPRPIDSDLRKWPIHPKELNFYFTLAEKMLAVTKDYPRGSSMQNILISRLYNHGYLKATELPLAIDMQGTRMGLDPDTSVVDQNTKVHGITGLYAAGNGVLPLLSAANPTLSSVALAIRLADHLVRKVS